MVRATKPWRQTEKIAECQLIQGPSVPFPDLFPRLSFRLQGNRAKSELITSLNIKRDWDISKYEIATGPRQTPVKMK